MRGVGQEADVTSRDPTLNAGRAPVRSRVACSKNLPRQYLTCLSELLQDLEDFDESLLKKK